jgi:hypothetical protein
MSNADRPTAQQKGDKPFRAAGVGMSPTFRCGACHQFKTMPGRRLKRVLGLRQYVCARSAGVSSS